MTAQPLFQFGTVTLHPTPDRRVIRLQTALGEQLFDIAQRERVAKIPAHRTKNQLRRRLPPLEDCRSGYVIHGLSGYQPTPPKLQHILLEAPHTLNDFGFGAGVAAHWIGEAQTYVNPPPPPAMDPNLILVTFVKSFQ